MGKFIFNLIVICIFFLSACARNIAPSQETMSTELEKGRVGDPNKSRQVQPTPQSIGGNLECAISKEGYNSRGVSVQALNDAQIGQTASTLNYEGHTVSVSSNLSISSNDVKRISMKIGAITYRNLNLLRSGLNVVGLGDGVELQCYPNGTTAMSLPASNKLRCRAEKSGLAPIEIPISSYAMNAGDRISSVVNFGGHRISVVHLLPTQSEGQNLLWLSLDSRYSKSYDYRGGGLSLEDVDGTKVVCDNFGS